MMNQTDMFNSPPPEPKPKPKPKLETGHQRKPWTQRRDEFMVYHRANPEVFYILTGITCEHITTGILGDAQRLYTAFKEKQENDSSLKKFPREYITFYVRLIMWKQESLRGYYKLNQQVGEPESKWSLWKDYRKNYGTQVPEKRK